MSQAKQCTLNTGIDAGSDRSTQPLHQAGRCRICQSQARYAAQQRGQ